MEKQVIQYRFRLKGNIQEIFEFSISEESIELVDNIVEPISEWAKLDNHKCSICPLNSAKSPYCPLAANLAAVVERFDHILSFDEIHLDVITKERTIFQQTTAQGAISSMMGLIMATSGCPHAAFFRPMAKFHLPLSNEKETFYRASSMYLLAQYFKKKSGMDVDFELKGLIDIYENMRIVNSQLLKRLRSETSTDSSINAVVHLDMFALSMPLVIEDSLEDIKHLFKIFLTGVEHDNPDLFEPGLFE